MAATEVRPDEIEKVRFDRVRGDISRDGCQWKDVEFGRAVYVMAHELALQGLSSDNN